MSTHINQSAVLAVLIALLDRIVATERRIVITWDTIVHGASFVIRVNVGRETHGRWWGALLHVCNEIERTDGAAGSSNNTLDDIRVDHKEEATRHGVHLDKDCGKEYCVEDEKEAQPNWDGGTVKEMVLVA